MHSNHNTNRATDPQSPDTPMGPNHRYWTPAKLLVAAVLVLGVAMPLGYLLWRELSTTFSTTVPLASAQSGGGGQPTGSGTRQAAAPLEQFDTSNLQVEPDRIRSGGPPQRRHPRADRP